MGVIQIPNTNILLFLLKYMFHALGELVENVFGISSDAAGLIIAVPAIIFLVYYYSKDKNK